MKEFGVVDQICSCDLDPVGRQCLDVWVFGRQIVCQRDSKVKECSGFGCDDALEWVV